MTWLHILSYSATVAIIWLSVTLIKSEFRQRWDKFVKALTYRDHY